MTDPKKCLRIYKGLYIEDIKLGMEAISPWKSFIKAIMYRFGFTKRQVNRNLKVIQRVALK